MSKHQPQMVCRCAHGAGRHYRNDGHACIDCACASYDEVGGVRWREYQRHHHLRDEKVGKVRPHTQPCEVCDVLQRADLR